MCSAPDELKRSLPTMFPNRAARTKAKQHLAKALKTSIRKVNHAKFCDKPLESVLRREKKAQKALEHRTKCAEQAGQVKDGAVSVKKAALECGISERQMARHVAKAMKEKEPCSETMVTNSPVA